MVKPSLVAWCFVFLAALGCSSPHTGGSPPNEPSEPGTEETGEADAVATCLDCPEPQLFCNAERNICICDVNGKVFPRASCPAPGAADPSPPPGCPASSWFCNLSGDCRCAQ